MTQEILTSSRGKVGRPRTRLAQCPCMMNYGTRCDKPAIEGGVCYYHAYWMKKSQMTRQKKKCGRRLTRHKCYHITKNGTQCSQLTSKLFCKTHIKKYTESQINTLITLHARYPTNCLQNIPQTADCIQT